MIVPVPVFNKLIMLFMVRRGVLTIIIASMLLPLCAEEVDMGMAAKVAANFSFERTGRHIEIPLEQTFIRGSGDMPYYYVFRLPVEGFVIVSAEDVMPPVLGYSFTEHYNHEDQPDSYRNFMQTYCDAIDHIREKEVVQPVETAKQWAYYLDPGSETGFGATKSKSVEPLVLSKWDQGYPYNALCPENPEGPGGHVLAGCVATAMSQVMYYWRYPMQGTGSHTYYYPPYGYITADFGNTNYQWNGMTKAISFYEPEPIAELQFHCGVGVEMMYGAGGSGAYSSDVPPALENYFGYSTDCYYTWKEDHSHNEWISMLKDNLDNGWPMYYSGYSSSGGHAFVCDGYDDDHFHFNFGWSGSSDGYYTLFEVGGFNNGQGAVFDTYPGSNYPYYCNGDKVLTHKKGSIEDGSGPVADYQDGASCSWLISPQTAEDSISHITITFLAFETEPNDVVSIYDGPTAQDNLLGEYSGDQIPDPITSGGNEVLIVFTSDGSGTGAGWLAEYLAHSPDYCSGVATMTDPQGSFTDGSGNFNYHNGTTCMWEIIPELEEPVTLYFTEFNTEADRDRVRVYDYETQELLAEYSGVYSGNNMPGPVTSPSGKMFVAFASNSSVTYEGWSAHYAPGAVGMVNSLPEKDGFRVYPNPVSDRLFVEMTEENSIIEILNLTGSKMLRQVVEEDQGTATEVDVSDLASGIYILRVITGSGSFARRIVIR